MAIRTTRQSDLGVIMDIYEHAREQMKKNGNPNQWGTTNPQIETIINDIENHNSYVIEHQGIICGIFSFIIGIDKTYQHIEGSWLNEDPYGTIHRLASTNQVKGILEECIKYCETKIDNIRCDTHQDNVIMKHLLEKNGFIKCGTIYVEDGSPRIAYQKVLSK